MKFKKSLIIISCFLTLIATLTSCSEKEWAFVDESSSETATDNESGDENTTDNSGNNAAFENAKTIYNTACSFSEICESHDVILGNGAPFDTGYLTINTYNTTNASITNIINDNCSISTTITEIEHYMNTAFSEGANGTLYRIEYKANGYPSKVYWKESADSSKMGEYPKKLEADSDLSEFNESILESKFTSANANAKMIYNATMAFSQKCEIQGVRIGNGNVADTGVMTVDSADTISASVQNVIKDNGINITKDGATGKEIIHAVNAAFSDDADGTVYRIIYGKNGFPSKVYWASSEDTSIVGMYPPNVENAPMQGGITRVDDYFPIK